jgi:hypothetical protein
MSQPYRPPQPVTACLPFLYFLLVIESKPRKKRMEKKEGQNAIKKNTLKRK